MVNPAEIRATQQVVERAAASNEAERLLNEARQQFRDTVAEYVALERGDNYKQLELYRLDDEVFAGREIGDGPNGSSLVVRFEESSHHILESAGQSYLDDEVDDQGNTVHVLMNPTYDLKVVDHRAPHEVPAADRDRIAALEATEVPGWREFDLDAVEPHGTQVLRINTSLVKRWSDQIKMSRL